MNHLAAVALIAVYGSVTSLGAQSLSIEVVGEAVSIEADQVGLGDLLGELDAAAGTRSTVPPELAARTVSVWFSGLPLDQAVRKVFEGLAIDYAVIGGEQIVVIAESQRASAAAGGRATPATGTLAGSTTFVQPSQGNAQPSGPGTSQFQIPGQVDPTNGVQGRGGGRGRGGRGFQGQAGNPLQPNGPGAGAPTPGGLPNGQPVPQPEAPNMFGNTSPAILDLNAPPQPAAQADPAPATQTPPETAPDP